MRVRLSEEKLGTDFTRQAYFDYFARYQIPISEPLVVNADYVHKSGGPNNPFLVVHPKLPKLHAAFTFRYFDILSDDPVVMEDFL